MRHTARELQRQIERCQISIEELEDVLVALATQSTRIECVIPKVVRLDTADRMLDALVSALRDRN